MKKTLKRVFQTTFLVQVIGVLIIPLIYYSFDEADFAKYGLFFSISAISSVFLTGRLENIFFSTKNYKKLYSFAVNVALFFGVLITLTLLFFHYYFYAVTIFCGLSIGLFNLGYNYLVRENKEILYNRIKVIRAFLELFSVVLVCLLSLNILYLLVFVSLSYFLIAFTVAFNDKVFSVRYVLDGYVDFKYDLKYVLSDFFSSIFNSLYIYLPTIYFYFNGSVSNSANYFLILKIFGVPTLMVAQSISTVIRQYAANEFQDKKNIIDTYAFFRGLCIKMFFPFVCLLFLTFLFFYFLDLFYIQGIFIYSIVLVFLIYIRAFFNTISSIVYVFKWQHLNIKFQFCLLLFSLLALMIEINGMDSIHLYAFISSLVYVVYMWVLYRLIVEKGYL